MSDERKASLAEKLRQAEASRNTFVTGVHHEIELSQQKVANLEMLLHTERALTSDYVTTRKRSKEQVERVTLGLPIPKGFGPGFSVVGRKKKQ